MKRKGIAFIISAPSGTGKTTTCNLLRQRIPELGFSVSHTSRSPRVNEIDGTDYHFIDEKEFLRLIDEEKFLEWAKVYNQYYGTSIDTILNHTRNGDDILLELDVQGVETLRKSNFPGVFIFLLPPSIEDLTTRLKHRNTEPDEMIRQRVEVGKGEIKKYGLYDYVMTNFEVEDTVQNLMSVIRAERCRKERYIPTSTDLKDLLAEASD